MEIKVLVTTTWYGYEKPLELEIDDLRHVINRNTCFVVETITIEKKERTCYLIEEISQAESAERALFNKAQSETKCPVTQEKVFLDMSLEVKE